MATLKGPDLNRRSNKSLTERDLETRLRRIEKDMTVLKSQNIDMNGRRVINARPSRNDHDYIIRQELSNAVESIRRQILNLDTDPDPGPDDLQQYALSYNVQRLNYGAASITDLVISKEGVQVDVSDRNIDGVYVVAACIDELDLGQHSIITVIPNLVNENAIVVTGLPTSWAVGDFICINDPSTSIIGRTSHEIFKITAIVGPAVTLVRDGSDPGILTSWFGTPKANHLGIYKAYKVEPINIAFPVRSGVFVNPSIRSGFAERLDLIIPNVCIVGLYVAIYNEGGFGRWTTKLLSTGLLSANSWESGDTSSRCPGLRTLNGAAYYISTTGTLSIGTESDYSIRPNDNSPIRCIWGYLDTAGVTTGSTDPVVTVEFIEVDEDTLVETVIETFNFYTGEIISGEVAYRPETRQLPYAPKPDLIGDNATYHWPIPTLNSSKRYKTKITGVGADTAGTNLVTVIST